MSAFAKILGSKTRHARSVCTVPPSAFADTWTRRPVGPIKMGLRLISETELGLAQSSAANAAWDAYERKEDLELRLEAYNDHLITNVLAQVLVQADDISKPYFAPAPEALIREALNAGGIRHLWAAYSALAIAAGELAPEATAEELAALNVTVVAGMAVVDAGSQTRIRRLARAILDEIAASTPLKVAV